MSDERVNLYDETWNFLREMGKSPADVLWVGNGSGTMAVDWEQFAELADYEYDSGFGGTEVAEDLVVVGDGWWLERWEYDGSEGWRFVCPPVRSSDARPFARVFGAGYEGIERMNPAPTTQEAHDDH